MHDNTEGIVPGRGHVRAGVGGGYETAQALKRAGRALIDLMLFCLFEILFFLFAVRASFTFQPIMRIED